jgi:hypothetical protein
MTTILVDSDECAEIDYCVRDILGVKDAVAAALERQSDKMIG